jgi:hypothetical protein
MELLKISPPDIELSLSERLKFIGGKSELCSRYAAYDFCYNYSQDFYKNERTTDLYSNQNRHISCLQLGLFLATWGMFRNSGLQKKAS